MTDTIREQARTYTWILEDRNTPSLKIVQPMSVEDDGNGGHVITGSDNCIYSVRGWHILKIELKGGVSPEQEAEIING